MRMLIAILAMTSVAYAGDPQFWGNYSPDIRGWFQTVMQPGWENSPNQGRSCCGIAEAFEGRAIEENTVTRDITIVIDDGKGAIPDGTVVYSPRDKIQTRFGNPVGKLIVFISIGNLHVYCLVPSVLY